MPDVAPRLLTPEETCAYLSVCRNTLLKLVKEGRVPEPIKLGRGDRSQRYDRAKLDYYIDHKIIG